jgi:phage FluMu protein gp41
VLDVYQHFLWTRALADKERLDAQAAADALRAALEEELSLLQDGLALAGQSAAGVELVARKVELLARVDNRRFARRFGG